MILPSYDAWVLARVMADLPIGDEVAGMTERWRGFAERMNGLSDEAVVLNTTADACEYFRPLMSVASQTKTSFLLLTHLSKDSPALGRRIVGASRVVWKLTHPDPEGQPDRRRFWVDKSYALKPPAMRMTIGDGGCTFDFEPPDATEVSKPGRAPVRVEACRRWLTERLTPN